MKKYPNTQVNPRRTSIAKAPWIQALEKKVAVKNGERERGSERERGRGERECVCVYLNVPDCERSWENTYAECLQTIDME